MEKHKLALIYGGISSEREVSLNSGKQVMAALDQQKYDIREYDPKTDISKLVADASEIDSALIILHGPFGEDGTVQGLLDLLGIPYQGAGVLGSAICMNKMVSKTLYRSAGLPVSKDLIIQKGSSYSEKEIIDQLGLPLVVKPASGGSSVGMSIVRSPERLTTAIDVGFNEDRVLMLEAFVDGIEITAGVLGNRSLEALPLIEIVPGEGYDFFDYEAKYKAGATNEICPARLDANLTRKAQAYAVKAHEILNCRGYSRTDMICQGEDFFVLETNTIPGMTATSLYPQSAKVAGYSFGQLMDRLIELSLEIDA